MLETKGRLQPAWEWSFGSQAGKAAPKYIQKVVCICGRAGNQQIFCDIRLEVLKSVVKLLLAAGVVQQRKKIIIFFCLHLLAAPLPYT